MLFSFENGSDSEKLKELVSLQNQVKAVNYKSNCVNESFMRI